MDGYVSVDYGHIQRIVNSAVNGVQANVNALRSEVDDRFETVDNSLEDLRRGMIAMIEENRRTAALQRAITEIVRVRQEIKDNYGNYQVVRNTMLGILGAADLNLIRETTLATIGEELMLQTPRYWLAPVLIALGAWISNKKPLAERALEEALKRDEEKTCLLFALVCRRNQRTEACFEWLSRYFRIQKSSDMKESIIAYIDAYTNGVFGEDRDNICEEYITKWMDELKEENPSFEREQIEYWKKTYELYCVDISTECKELAASAPADFEKINAFVSRLKAVPLIKEFFDGILKAEIDRKALVASIDNELIKLVSNYDEEEAPLREEEAFFMDVKNKNGDEHYAEERRKLRRMKRMDNHVDLAKRLSDAINSSNVENISAKKTAIRFLKEYISAALGEFITEKAVEYPEEITLSVNGWVGKTRTGANKQALVDDYKKKKENERAEALSKITNGGWIALLTMWLMFLAGGIGCIVGSVVGGIDALIYGGVILIALSFLFMGLFIGKKKKTTRNRNNTNENYDRLIKEGVDLIEKTIAQRIACDELIKNFNPDVYQEILMLMEEN